MRLVFGLVLLIGIGLAGFAVYMAQGYINSTQVAVANERAASQAALKAEREKREKLAAEKEAALAAERAKREAIQVVPTVKVYVMTTPKAYGDRISRNDVRTVDWPRDSVPEGSFILASDGSQSLFPQDAEGLRAATRERRPDARSR